jgi:hypothetical protein
MIQVVKQTPDILELRMVERNLKLTGDQIQKWKSKMDSCIKSNTQLNFMEYIHADAQQFIKDRLQLYDDQKNTNWAAEWNTSWSAKNFFDAIDVIWPKGVDNAVDFSIETRLNKAKPNINMSSALDDINSWTTLVGRAALDEKKRLGTDIPVDRQSQLIKILIDHFSRQESPLTYIRQAIEKGGRPNTIEAFNRKAMLAGGEIQKAVHCIDVCGFTLVPKNSKRPNDQTESAGTNKKFRHNDKTQGRSSKWSEHERPSQSHTTTNAPQVCKGCGKHHTGECLFRTHPDFNNSSLAWHESDIGKAYWEKGMSSLSKDPPYINGTEWANKPAELSSKDNPRRQQNQSFHRGRGGRGLGMILSSLTNNNHNVLIRSIVVVFPYDRKDARGHRLIMLVRPSQRGFNGKVMRKNHP